MHNLDVRMLLFNSFGEAWISGTKMSDIQIFQLAGGGDKSFHALLGDIVTHKQIEALQLRAVLRQQSKAGIIDLGPCKDCNSQLGTRCDEYLNVIASEPMTEINHNMSELGTVLCYDVYTLGS